MIYDIADNGVLTIAVGGNGLILVSTDNGSNWEIVVAGISNALYGVAYGYAFDQPRWVVVGENGIILASPDGYNWTTQTPFTGNTLYSVAWAGVFLTVGASGVLGASADLGAVWEPKSSGTSEDLYDITVDNGLYAIVGANETFIAGSITTLELESFIEESIGASAVESSIGTFSHNQIESFESVDGYGWSHIDGVTLVETAGGELQYDWVTEEFIPFDTISDPTGTFAQTIAESALAVIYAQDNIKALGSLQDIAALSDISERTFRCFREATDSLVLSSVITSAQATNVLEALSVIGAGLSASKQYLSCADRLSLKEATIVSWLKLVAETVNLTPTADRYLELGVTLVERLLTTATVTSREHAVVSVAIALAILDNTDGGKGAEATESVAITPELADRIRAKCILLDRAEVTSTASMTSKLIIPVTDRAMLDGDLASTVRLQDLVADGIAFQLLFNDGTETYTGWVMNTRNFAVTQYQDYPFNSFAKIGTTYLGANGTGLYRLDGDTDAGDPIEASVTLGATDFDSPMRKRLDSMYLGFRLDGGMILKTVTEENIERWYELEGSNEKLHRRRVHPLAKGLTSMYWQVKLLNVDGADFDLRSIEFVPVSLSRRI